MGRSEGVGGPEGVGGWIVDESMVWNRYECMHGWRALHLCIAVRFTLSAVFLYPSYWAR